MKDFNNQFNRNKPKNNPKLILTPGDMSGIIKAVNFFRNVCAHEERFYNYSTSKIRAKSLFSYFNQQELSRERVRIKTLTIILKAVLNKKNSNALMKGMRRLLKKYEGKFRSDTYKKILYKMGFNYDDIDQFLDNHSKSE